MGEATSLGHRKNPFLAPFCLFYIQNGVWWRFKKFQRHFCQFSVWCHSWCCWPCGENNCCMQAVMGQDNDEFSLEMFRRPAVVDLLVRVVFEGGQGWWGWCGYVTCRQVDLSGWMNGNHWSVCMCSEDQYRFSRQCFQSLLLWSPPATLISTSPLFLHCTKSRSLCWVLRRNLINEGNKFVQHMKAGIKLTQSRLKSGA